MVVGKILIGGKMKVFVIIAFLGLLISSVFAGQTIEFPTEPQNNSWFNAPVSNKPVDEQVSPVIAKKIEGILDEAEIAPPSGNLYNGKDIGGSSGNSQPLWNADILVMSHGNPTFGKLSTDNDETNGDIYVSLLVPNSGVYDSAYTYRSTDGGATWNYLMAQTGASSGTGGIRDHQILVGFDGTDSWIYSFCLYDSSASMGGIWVLRVRPDLSDYDWTQVVVGGDSIENISADRNVETPQHIFLGYSLDTDHLRIASSSDYSLTWGNYIYVSANGNHPSVCAGGDGYGYIAYAKDTTEIAVGRFTNNLVSPSWSFNYLNTEDEGDWTPSVAAARTSPGGSQVAWCLWRHRHSNGNADIHNAYTDDGGLSWNFAPWPPTNSTHSTWDMKHPYCRMSYGSSIVRAIATVPESGPDSLVYAFSRETSPTVWEDRGVHNDYGITGEFGGRVDYSQDCSGGYITYREYGDPKVWFDAYNNTAVAEKPNATPSGTIKIAPNPTTNTVNLNYTVKNPGDVKISLYDVSGKLVKNILDAQKETGVYETRVNTRGLATGIYFIRIESNGETHSLQVSVVK
jgi:hypothetical protein